MLLSKISYLLQIQFIIIISYFNIFLTPKPAFQIAQKIATNQHHEVGIEAIIILQVHI